MSVDGRDRQRSVGCFHCRITDRCWERRVAISGASDRKTRAAVNVGDVREVVWLDILACWEGLISAD